MARVRKLRYGDDETQLIVEQPYYTDKDGVKHKLKKWIHNNEVVWQNGKIVLPKGILYPAGQSGWLYVFNEDTKEFRKHQIKNPDKTPVMYNYYSEQRPGYAIAIPMSRPFIPRKFESEEEEEEYGDRLYFISKGVISSRYPYTSTIGYQGGIITDYTNILDKFDGQITRRGPGELQQYDMGQIGVDSGVTYYNHFGDKYAWFPEQNTYCDFVSTITNASYMSHHTYFRVIDVTKGLVKEIDMSSHKLTESTGSLPVDGNHWKLFFTEPHTTFTYNPYYLVHPCALWGFTDLGEYFCASLNTQNVILYEEGQLVTQPFKYSGMWSACGLTASNYGICRHYDGKGHAVDDIYFIATYNHPDTRQTVTQLLCFHVDCKKPSGIFINFPIDLEHLLYRDGIFVNNLPVVIVGARAGEDGWQYIYTQRVVDANSITTGRRHWHREFRIFKYKMDRTHGVQDGDAGIRYREYVEEVKLPMYITVPFYYGPDSVMDCDIVFDCRGYYDMQEQRPDDFAPTSIMACLITFNDYYDSKGVVNSQWSSSNTQSPKVDNHGVYSTGDDLEEILYNSKDFIYSPLGTTRIDADAPVYGWQAWTQKEGTSFYGVGPMIANDNNPERGILDGSEGAFIYIDNLTFEESPHNMVAVLNAIPEL